MPVHPPTQTLFIPQAIQHGLQLHTSGQLQQAIDVYQKILTIEANNTEVLHLLGVAYAQQQDYTQAETYILQAIQHTTDNSNYYNSLANVYWYQKHTGKALQFYQQALKLNPHQAESHNGLGNVFKAQNQLEKAVKHYQQALKINPHYADACNNLSIVLKFQGKFTEAIHYCQQALTLNPNLSEAYTTLGSIAKDQGRLAEAVEHYQKALSINPNSVTAYNNLGIIYQQQAQHEQAIRCYQQALSLNPQQAETYNNLGIIYNELGQITQAILYYQEALKLNSNYAEAHNNLGTSLLDKGQSQDALYHYQKAFEIKPDYAAAQSNYVYALNFLPEYDLVQLYQAHQAFNQQHAAPLQKYIQPYENLPDPNKCLKIGYYSPDFRKHSLTYFILPILAHHQHAEFEIYCYYNNTKVDEITQKIQQCADHWINCVGWTDEQLATKIHQDQIDILVDFSGHTGKNHLLTFARKPAPIQFFHTIGYSNTTGLTAIDYRITDNYVDPEIHSQYSAETLVCMPHSYYCYSPNMDTPLVNELPNLRNGYITLGSFNAYSKLNDQTLGWWADILHALPQARLKLLAKSFVDAEVKQMTLEKFKALGIAMERLQLGYATSSEATLAHYHQVDIALDTYPFNGATTTCQALWMGVPVLTLVGKTPAARAGLSILTTVGLNDWVTDSPQNYVTACVQLSKNIEALQILRQQLRTKMQTSPLMDGAKYTQYLENKCREAWQHWCMQV